MWHYDKRLVGERVRFQRKALNLTRDELAERVECSTKFCADVERGTTGMSIETMLLFCQALRLSPNLLLLGEACQAEDESLEAIERALAECTPHQREIARELLVVHLKAYRE